MDGKHLIENRSGILSAACESCVLPAFLIHLDYHVSVTSFLPTCLLNKSHAGQKLFASAACSFLHGKGKFSCLCCLVC